MNPIFCHTYDTFRCRTTQFSLTSVGLCRYPIHEVHLRSVYTNSVLCRTISSDVVRHLCIVCRKLSHETKKCRVNTPLQPYVNTSVKLCLPQVCTLSLTGLDEMSAAELTQWRTGQKLTSAATLFKTTNFWMVAATTSTARRPAEGRFGQIHNGVSESSVRPMLPKEPYRYYLKSLIDSLIDIA
jgi:hypothetical protein